MKTKITLFLSTLLLTVLLIGGSDLFNFHNTATADDDCKHENAECTVNESDKPCCPGLTCVPYNPSSENGKCERSTSTTTTTTPCNGECCETTTWSCESCLKGPDPKDDKCFVTKWDYCKKEYSCDFETDGCDVRDCGEWSCPTDCKDTPPTPIDCVYHYGDCSVACGGGTQPVIVDVPAENGGLSCPTEPQTCNEQACPTVTLTPTPIVPPAGHGDGLSDGRSDGGSSCPECTQASGIGGGQVLGASTGPTKAVLGLSTTSGENELVKLAQIFGSFVLSMFGLAFYKKSA